VTKPNDLQQEILKELKRYSFDVAEKIEAAKDETAKALQKDIKQKSPEKTGSYKKGWRIKKTKFKSIVHNATDYQLTHLLEYGHPKRNGGRVNGIPHIRPAEEKAVKDFLEKIEQAVKQ
jgi:hypothetical protein